jgi:hypothetical protein
MLQALPPVSPTSSPHPWLPIADFVAKVAIALVGAVWAWINYVRGRTFYRRLEPKISGEIFAVDDAWFISIDPSVKNVGLSRALIIQEGTWIELIVLQRDGTTKHVAEPIEVALGKPPVFEKHGWVEAGEEIHDVRLVQLPEKTTEDVAVRANLRVVSKELAWVWKEDVSSDRDDSGELKIIRERRLEWNAGCVVMFQKPVLPEAGKGVAP